MITLINLPGLKSFSGLQMHTPNPPLGLAYIAAAVIVARAGDETDARGVAHGRRPSRISANQER